MITTYVMSMAGLDPSGGAGLLADIKTFEAHGVYGLGVCTALTVQTEDTFLEAEWLTADKIIAQAVPLLKKYPVGFCKVGIVSHPEILAAVFPALRKIRPALQFILDPVLSASAGYMFHASAASRWQAVLPGITLLTPNYSEATALTGEPSGEKAAILLSQHCAVLLKGGHRELAKGRDTLYRQGECTDFFPETQEVFPKHGSGCVLSAAITAALAKGLPLAEACAAGKRYTAAYLRSNTGLLGWHKTLV